MSLRALDKSQNSNVRVYVRSNAVIAGSYVYSCWTNGSSSQVVIAREILTLSLGYALLLPHRTTQWTTTHLQGCYQSVNSFLRFAIIRFIRRRMFIKYSSRWLEHYFILVYFLLVSFFFSPATCCPDKHLSCTSPVNFRHQERWSGTYMMRT